MKRFFFLFLMPLIVLLPVFAGGEQENDDQHDAVLSNRIIENSGDHITIVDSYENQVTLKKPVKSFVSNGMGQVFAAVKAMNAESMAAASSGYVTRNATFFPILSELPAISVGEESVDNELVMQLHPDVILTNPFLLAQFSESVTAEIPVVQLACNSTEAYRVLGAILGKEKDADDFIRWIQSYTDRIDERIAMLSEEEYQEVFIYYGGQYGMSAPPPYGTFGKDNFLRNELISRAGGKSITNDIAGEWIVVDPEWVIERNPPLIIRECYILNDHPEMGYSVTDSTAADKLMDSILTQQPAFESCDAVRDGKVYMMYGDLVEDSWFISLIYMAKWFHPDLFEDLDPEKMHQEYMYRFQRLDFDVQSHGLFTYSAKDAMVRNKE